MSEEQSWDITPREYNAHKQVHDSVVRRWAISAAMYANAHRGEFTEAFEPDHFMGLKKRKDTGRNAATETVSKWNASMENLRLSKILPGGPIPEGLPIWAMP